MTKKKRGKTRRKRKQATRLPTVDEIMNDNTEVIVHADGSKTIKAGPAMQAIMRQQRESFREKFGRDPLPHEPVFFDPDADEPQPIEDEPMDDLMASAAQQAGISEEIIYAMQKTGMIIVAGVNEHLFTTEDKEEWLAAIDEFRARD